MTSANKKILVTGGAGFLGSHVVRLLLQAGNEVVVIDDFSNGKASHLESCSSNPCLKVITGDITNPDDVNRAINDCGTVVHLAVLGLRQSIKQPARVNEVIVRGTINCLEAARLNDIELFLNCSSSEVYGSAIHVPMDENHPLNPETPYAAAKVAQDMYVSSYGRTYGLEWTTIRPFNMYGPNSHWQGFRGELIPKMIVRAMNGLPLVIFGDGSQTRDFVYVEEAAKALVAMIANPSCRRKCMNFCSGSEIPIRKIAELICLYFDLDPKEYICHEAPRPGDVKCHRGDNTLCRQLLGFVPEISIEQGLPRTIAWFESLRPPDELLSQEVLRSWE